MGSELSLLWKNLCDISIFVCGSPSQQVWDSIISRVRPSYHLSGLLLYVFGRRISFLVGSSLFYGWLFSS